MPPPKKKAKCSANQPLVDILVKKHEQVQHQPNFSRTLLKAITNLSKHQDSISGTADAMKINGIGSALARIMFPAEHLPKPRPGPSRSGNNNAGQLLPGGGLSQSSGPVGSDASMISQQQQQGKRRKRLPQNATTRREQGDIPEPVSKKEVAYQEAIARSGDYKNKSLNWRVVLLVDGREVNCVHVQAKCQMSGIPCENRMLPIGDMLWVAQGYASSQQRNSGTAPQAELVLGTIIERKTTNDLRQSIVGTRYMEQRLRLTRSGLPQLLYLVEGDPSKDNCRCPEGALHTAMWETRLHQNFQVIQTSHMDDTVQTLKRMHRRILQRTFPNAFKYNEGLPTFAEPDATGSRTNASRSQQQQQDDDERHQQLRHRRKRLKSLMEMSFDMDPIPPLNMPRFISYEELKAKIERDREAGTRTVGGIHAAMLLQVPTFGQKSVEAVLRLYPTPSALLAAYDTQPDENAKKNLVADLLTSEARYTQRSSRIGAKGSLELYHAYGKNFTLLAGSPTTAACPSAHLAFLPDQDKVNLHSSHDAAIDQRPAVKSNNIWCSAQIADTMVDKGSTLEEDRQSSPSQNTCVPHYKPADALSKKSSSALTPSNSTTTKDAATLENISIVAHHTIKEKDEEKGLVDLTSSPDCKLPANASYNDPTPRSRSWMTSFLASDSDSDFDKSKPTSFACATTTCAVAPKGNCYDKFPMKERSKEATKGNESNQKSQTQFFRSSPTSPISVDEDDSDNEDLMKGIELSLADRLHGRLMQAASNSTSQSNFYTIE